MLGRTLPHVGVERGEAFGVLHLDEASVAAVLRNTHHHAVGRGQDRPASVGGDVDAGVQAALFFPGELTTTKRRDDRLAGQRLGEGDQHGRFGHGRRSGRLDHVRNRPGGHGRRRRRAAWATEKAHQSGRNPQHRVDLPKVRAPGMGNTLVGQNPNISLQAAVPAGASGRELGAAGP
jgi:hypothetical protein